MDFLVRNGFKFENDLFVRQDEIVNIATLLRNKVIKSIVSPKPTILMDNKSFIDNIVENENYVYGKILERLL